MPLNQKNELAQVVEESTLPIEHNGGDGWTILHGDTLQIIRAFKPQVFDALITDPPYASGGWKPAEKNRTTTQKYSSMDPVPLHHRRFAMGRMDLAGLCGVG